MFKFLHAADVHLDSPQLGLDRYEGAPVVECRGATRRALENLVRLAVEERVAFVLIVGDLYDGDWHDYNTGLFLGLQLGRLRDAGIPVVMIRGNHDASSLMTKDLRLPPNARVLSPDRPETHVIDGAGVAIHGQSFADRAVRVNLAKTYPQRTGGLFNVGILHTSVNGREGHETYAPCSLDDMRRLGYDYWALGHVHRRETLHDCGPVIAFPGNVQGRSVREPGAKGCLLVTVDDAGVATCETRWLDVVRWKTCRVDATGAADGEELLDRFQADLAGLVAESEGRLLALRVEVQGACRAHDGLAADWPRWTNEVRQVALQAGGGRVWVEKVVAKTGPPEARDDPPADAALAELHSVLDDLRGDEGRLLEFGLRELDDLRKRVPAEILRGLETPEGLRELLDQIGPLLFNRLGVNGSGPKGGARDAD